MNVGLLTRLKAPILAHPERIDINVRWQCGACYCLGGLVLAIAGRAVNVLSAFEDARDACDLTSDEAERLFILTSWPAPLRKMYRDAETPTERAAIVVQRLQFFIETEGRA